MSETLASLPPAEQHPHGTRARYVGAKCRCAPCKEANRLYYHQRQAMVRERVAELMESQRVADQLLGPPEPKPAPQVWTAPDGSQQIRVYSRLCPGVGNPCRFRAHLRKDSKGGLCGGCRSGLVFNGLVSAERAREHLLRLSAGGIGRRSVTAACDVSATILTAIRKGKRTQIRASTEKRILAVDVGAAADHSAIPAGPTRGAIRELQQLGLSKAEISRRLGNAAPALQLNGRRVLARNAAAIAKVLRDEKEERRRCGRCGQSHRGDKVAADWCRKNRNVPLDELEAQALREQSPLGFDPTPAGDP